MSPNVRRASIVILALLLPVAAHALWDYIELRRLVTELQRIRAKGEPVIEQEAGRGYRRLSETEELAGRYFMAAGVLAYPVSAKGRGATLPIYELVAGAPPKNLDRAALAAKLASLVGEGQQALALADHAVTLPFTGFPAGTSYNYRTSELLSLLSLLSIRTVDHSLRGEGDAAVNAAVVSIRSRAAVSSTEPWWFRSSASDTAAILSFSTPSQDALRWLLSELQQQDRPAMVEKDVIADRASFIERTFREFYGGDPRAPAGYRLRSRGFSYTLWRPWSTRNFVRALHRWERLIEASRKPWPQKGQEMAAVYGPHRDPAAPAWYWFFPPSLRVAFEMYPRNTRDHLAADRAAATAIGVALYRADHGGVLPGTLGELVPTYMRDLPADPATGQPLLFRTDETSFTIYSVGANATDDGGDLSSELRKVEDQGWGLRVLRGKDVGIRVLVKP